MASEHRAETHTVSPAAEELRERVRSYDFLAAVRQLECMYPNKPRVGGAVKVDDEIVRLSQQVSLAFKGHSLESLEPSTGVAEHRLHVNFMGLLGSHGPMPLHYTEYADQRSRHHDDPTFKEFIDLFNHRMLSLFYRASVQFDPAVCFDRPDSNSYVNFLGALCGVLPPASSDRDTLSESAIRYYPGWHSNNAKSPDGIVAMVTDYFGLPVEVREWVGGWLSLPENAITRLGSQQDCVQLGRSLYVGRRVWSTRHKFKVRLGPLDWDTFSSFKPGGERAKLLHDLVRKYVGDEWDWDLELRLKEGEVRSVKLDRSNALGVDSWIKSKKGRRLPAYSVLLNKKQICRVMH